MAKKSINKLTQEEESNSLNIVDIVGLCISNWQWFIISLAVTLSLAALYLKITPPVYKRNTSIVIKEDTNNQAVDNVFARLRNGRSSTRSTSLKNEIIALCKPALMAKVAERLDLDYEYQIRGKLRNTTLYASSLPIKAEITNSKSPYTEFRVKYNGNGDIEISSDNKLSLGKSYEGRFDKPIKTPFGTITIHQTPAFYPTKDYITVTHTSIEAAAGRFLGSLSVTNTDDESSVIDISLQDVNIQRADDILNTLIAVYNEQWITNRNQVIVATNKFIGERLIAIEQELGDVENEMTNYKVSNHTLDFADEGGRYMGRSIEYENKALSMENELTLTRYFKDYISKVKNYNHTLPLSAGINNPALSQQVNQYNALVLNRSNIVASSTESNPLVTDIDRELAVLLHGIIITIDNHINTINTQVKLLKANDDINNERIDQTPTKQKLFVDIERRRKIKEQLYTFLLQTREQNELQQAFEAYNTRVLQPSSGSNRQTFPNVKNVWLLAIGIGLGIPLLLIVIREWSNTKVRGRRDIEKLTVPFVGELPHVTFPDEIKSVSQYISDGIKTVMRLGKKDKKQKYTINKVSRAVVRAGSRNVINEAYRVLRTNVEFIIGQNKDTKVIMTTSANPGSGKTFISYNLALCMSLKGKKVIAIDLDLRRRSLSEYVNKPDLGVADYINGAVDDWHDLLVKSEGSKTFDILPVGTLPPNPAEIISYDSFAKLIEEIREEYDYIFFDCPPVEVVADTAILAKYADITLFVVRVGLMEQDFLDIIEEYYEDRKFNNMGIILNGTLTANSRYGYRRYGYRYGYGYGYGYGGYGYGHSYSDGYSSTKK
ncbi:MAG: polysaccharide biosynthesis tyrosine autokinase [Prevotella sp.]|nr:polysaccharide biosynthesis tyrosine autokinase [Candidatus Prevotella equi]